MAWSFVALRRYAEFRGRSRRREYWMFVLLVLLALAAAGIAMIVANGSFRTQANMANSYARWAGFTLLPLIVPLIAVTVRRLHDLGLNGWWVLALPIGAMVPAIDALVPFVHIIVMALPGRTSANRFGDDPKRAGVI